MPSCPQPTNLDTRVGHIIDNLSPYFCHLLPQAWTGHCAMAQAPPSTNTGAPWPLRNFLINKQ